MNEKNKNVSLPVTAKSRSHRKQLSERPCGSLSPAGQRRAAGAKNRACVQSYGKPKPRQHRSFGATSARTDRLFQLNGSRRYGTCPQQGAATCLRHTLRHLQEEHPLLGQNWKKRLKKRTWIRPEHAGGLEEHVYTGSRKAFGKEPCRKGKTSGGSICIPQLEPANTGVASALAGLLPQAPERLCTAALCAC